MPLSDIAKRMTAVIGVSLLLPIAASIAYYRSFAFLPFAFGVLLGAALNVLKVVMLDRTVKRVIDMGKKNAENYVRFQHFLRFLLTGLAFLAAAFLPFINIWGTAAGICTMQIAILFTKRSHDGKKKTDDAPG